MRKQSIAVASLLTVLACFLAYRLIRQWQTYQIDHRVARLKPQVSPTTPASVRPPGSAQSLNFSAIPDNHPFHVERNNTIPPDPPPLTQPKATGPKPILMGTMGFSGNSYALMVSTSSREPSVYRKVKVGEALDGYTLMKILPDKVVMSADGSEVDVRLDEQPRPKPQAPAYAGAVDAANRVASMDGPGTASSTVSRADVRPAPQDVPEGTVVNGKRKRLVASPFGPTIVWEDVP